MSDWTQICEALTFHQRSLVCQALRTKVEQLEGQAIAVVALGPGVSGSFREDAAFCKDLADALYNSMMEEQVRKRAPSP